MTYLLVDDFSDVRNFGSFSDQGSSEVDPWLRDTAQGPSSPGLLVLERPRGVSEHQEARGTAKSLCPPRFNETAASELIVDQLVLFSPRGVAVRSCDSLPRAWPGSRVSPGPTTSQETGIYVRIPRRSCWPSRADRCPGGCPGSLESPL